MSAKHTQNIQPPYKLTNTYCLYDDVGRQIAKVEREPDALLFAAAPCLLAALEECEKELAEWVGFEELSQESGSRLICERARAAIARAKGEA